MDLGIKELGITLIVGVFTLLGAEVIAHYLFGRPLTTFFQDIFKGHKPSRYFRRGAVKVEQNDSKEATFTVAVFVGLVFAVGLIVETISFKYVDDQTLIFKTFPARVMGDELTRTIGMPPKDDDRIAALLGSLDNPHPSPLAVDLAHRDAFLLSDNSRTGQRVQDWVKSSNHDTLGPSRSDVEKSIANLYYYAKNMAYSHQNHYHELSQIQARLEFARSLAVIGLFYLPVVVVIGCLKLGLLGYRRKFQRARPQTPLERLSTVAWRTAVVAAMCFGVYWCGLWAYARETEAFNRRAFGYLSSHLLEERLAAQQAVELEANKQKLQAPKDNAAATAVGPVLK
jgi:hypothetical protein